MKTEEFPKPNIRFIERIKELDGIILDTEIEISLLKEMNTKEEDGIDFAKKSAENIARVEGLIKTLDEFKKEKDLLLNLIKSNSN